ETVGGCCVLRLPEGFAEVPRELEPPAVHLRHEPPKRLTVEGRLVQLGYLVRPAVLRVPLRVGGRIPGGSRDAVRVDVVRMAVVAVAVVADHHGRTGLADDLDQPPRGLVEVRPPEDVGALI